jgi:phosphotransferase system enzyme I (PtsI)
MFRGIGVSNGIAFGNVHVVDRRRVAVPHYHIPEVKRDKELARFEASVRKSEKQLGELSDRARTSGFDQVRALLDAHAMILRDEALFGSTRDLIERQGQNAEWALKDTVRNLKGLFDNLEEDYFRERRSDVDIVGDRILRNLVGAETDLLDNLSEEAVVVAYDLTPADTLALAKFAARAFVTEVGGRNSHVAILARALNVPCVLGVRGIITVAGTGDEIIVDAYAGEVVLRPSGDVSGRYRGIERRRHREEEALLADRELPAETKDHVRVELLGNIEVATEIELLERHGGEGVGLYRTEFLCLERPDVDDAEGHYLAYRQLVTALRGKPATIRTFDLGGDKPFGAGFTKAIRGEANPALGLRAIRLSLVERDRFEQQVEGILRASAQGPVRLLLPFVTGVDEVRAAKSIIRETHDRLEGEGHRIDPAMKIGVMIETPASVMMVDRIAEEVDFLSIGTNDLVQHTLAADRANDAVAHLHRPCHPAVIRMIQMVVAAAKDAKRPLSVCGEMAGDPFHAPLLVGLGIRTLSMTPKSIPIVKRMIRRLDSSACAKFAEQAASMATTRDVELALETKIMEWAPDLFS